MIFDMWPYLPTLKLEPLNMSEVVVIDYGMGNLLSVSRGFEHCGANVTVTSDPDIILSAPKVVLPGVGAFKDGMAELRRQRLDEVLREVVAQNNFILGICLGMQMLLSKSEEFGMTEGLGIIPGLVLPIPLTTTRGYSHKVPHIGWSNLVFPEGLKSWNGGLLQDVNLGDSVYFLHSFMAVPNDPDHRIANCVYGNTKVAAIIGRDKIYGCQFHPEKSGEVGLKVLRRFLSL
jgi:imidazole glycerol-phosphate synthase subunit HisH